MDAYGSNRRKLANGYDPCGYQASPEPRLLQILAENNGLAARRPNLEIHDRFPSSPDSLFPRRLVSSPLSW